MNNRVPEKPVAMNHNIIQLIQTMLAPGIMIIACGLLLLGINNKYSTIVDRIRLLKDEKRKLYGKNGINDAESNRISNIELQISHLIHRISMVKFAVFSYSGAITMFVVSGILIGLKINIEINAFYWIILGFFFAGMSLIITGIVFAAIEVGKASRIVKIEISEVYEDKG